MLYLGRVIRIAAAFVFAGVVCLDAQFLDFSEVPVVGGEDALLGWRYEHGDEVPQDYQKAAELYTKAAAQGNPDAQEQLGSLYGVGKG